MVGVKFTKEFRLTFSKIKDEMMKAKIRKQIQKIKENSEVGKPMGYSKKGTRELYIRPFRLSYSYIKTEDTVYILDLYHKDEQ